MPEEKGCWIITAVTIQCGVCPHFAFPDVDGYLLWSPQFQYFGPLLPGTGLWPEGHSESSSPPPGHAGIPSSDFSVHP